MFLSQTQAAERPSGCFCAHEVVFLVGVVVEGGFPELPVGLGDCGFLDQCRLGGRLVGEFEGSLVELLVEDDVEGFGEFGSDFAVVAEVELLEDGLVELPPDRLWRGLVGGLKVGGEVEGALEVAHDHRVLVVGAGVALLDVGELVGDAFLFGLEQVERDRVGVVSLEELGAFGEELLASRVEQFPLGVGLLEERFELGGEAVFDSFPYFGWELLAGVMVEHFALDGLDEYGAEGAVRAFLVASGADEVGVDLAVPVAGVGDDQPALAAVAVDRAFEVVVVLALAFPGRVVGLEDVLGSLPGLRGHERLVLAGVFDTAVADETFVVGVDEDSVEV